MSRKKKRLDKEATHPASSLQPASRPDEEVRAEAYRSDTIAAPSIDLVEAPSADTGIGMSELGRKEAEVVRPAPPSKLEAFVQSGRALSETTLRIVRSLMESSYEYQERNLGGLNKLLECRTPQDFAALQCNLLRDNIESFLAYGRRMHSQ